jgi:hypothetical protein
VLTNGNEEMFFLQAEDAPWYGKDVCKKRWFNSFFLQQQM